MFLSIVIPAWNEAALLPKTLETLRHACAGFTAMGRSWEIIVCDNNSTDATAAIARAAGAQVIFEPVNQISRARNTGASAASGEWLLFLDADSLPSPELMDELHAAISDRKTLYGGCAMEMDVQAIGVSAVLTTWHALARLMSWAAGSFLYVRRSAFTGSGGFSTALFAGEELELSARLRTLAKTQGRRFVFIKSPRLLTSGRKLRNYSAWQHCRVLWRIIRTGGRSLRDKKDCGLWYEGR